MKKSYINYILFITMLILGLIQVISGFLLWLVIPNGGYQGGRGTIIGEDSFIWDRHIWTGIHDWTAVALIAIVIIHIILHWDWICSMTRKMLTKPVHK